VRRRYASHITVVFSKAAHSGASVCLRARAPCPLRVSRPGVLGSRNVQQACCTLSVQCELQARACSASCRSLRLRVSGQNRLWALTSSSHTAEPDEHSCASLLVPRSVDTSLRTVQTHLCLCAKYCSVSRTVYVYRRTVSFVDDLVALALTRLHFSPDFPRFVSF
jgi:hypothetical protein